tara:strand:- start:2292 stop:3257 length:966 start_codon:yes stop_codon:yes gene_type:complete
MITVLLPVFNGDKWISLCIESILKQTYENFEFLIINDGSNDRSLEIIKKYSTLDQRIKYISQKNMGLTASLNKGINIASNDWIARIDADDISCPLRLEKQLNKALKENLKLVGSKFAIINEKGKILRNHQVPINKKKLIKNLNYQKLFFPHSSAFFNKKAVSEIGNYRTFFKKSQDYDLWLRISEKYKIGCIDYIGTYIRQHNNRLSFNDYGVEQKILAHCANVSHNIRIKNNLIYDPLDHDKVYAEKFKKYVQEILNKKGYINFYKKLYKLHIYIGEKNFKLIFLLMDFKFIKKFILRKILGDDISKKISNDWILRCSKN